MGAHVNGPSLVKIDKENRDLCAIIHNQDFINENDGREISISELFELNAEKFLGKKYVE